MVRRSLVDDCLGDIPSGFPDDASEAQGTAHLRRELVLSGVHCHDRGASPRKQSSIAGLGVWLEVLHRMGWRSGCDVQWWYGHNAVGFFLTAGFLAIMYYFIPKRAERPIYSYRLSIIHFWALIFLYI